MELYILDQASRFQKFIVNATVNISNIEQVLQDYSNIVGVFDIGDLDKDGSADLYYITYPLNGDTSSTYVYVFSANPNFQYIIMEQQPPIGTHTPVNNKNVQEINAIFVPDFDNDGYPDINIIKTISESSKNVYYKTMLESVGGPEYQNFIADSLIPITVADTPNFLWSMGRLKTSKYKDLIGVKTNNLSSGYVEAHVMSFKAPKYTISDYNSVSDNYDQCKYCTLLNWDVITFNGTQSEDNTSLCPDYTQCYNSNDYAAYNADGAGESCKCCYCGDLCCTAEPSPAANPITWLYTDIADFCNNGQKFIGIIAEQVTTDKTEISSFKDSYNPAFEKDKYKLGAANTYLKYGFAYRSDKKGYDLYYAISLKELKHNKQRFINVMKQYLGAPPSKCTGKNNDLQYCDFKNGLLYKIFNNKAIC